MQKDPPAPRAEIERRHNVHVRWKDDLKKKGRQDKVLVLQNWKMPIFKSGFSGLIFVYNIGGNEHAALLMISNYRRGLTNLLGDWGASGPETQKGVFFLTKNATRNVGFTLVVPI